MAGYKEAVFSFSTIATISCIYLFGLIVLVFGGDTQGQE